MQTKALTRREFIGRSLALATGVPLGLNLDSGPVCQRLAGHTAPRGRESSGWFNAVLTNRTPASF